MSNNDNQVPQGFWKALFEFAQNVGAQDPVNQTPSNFQQMSEEVFSISSTVHVGFF